MLVRTLMAVVLFCAISAGTAFADDPVVGVANDDPLMAQAAEKASETLDGFLELLEDPPADTHDYAIKLGIADKGDGYVFSRGNSDLQLEFFWIVYLERSGDTFTGFIGNEPETVGNVTAGQKVQFQKSDIFDWLYFEGDKLRGNWTACPALLSGPEELRKQFEDEYGLDCAL